MHGGIVMDMDTSARRNVHSTDRWKQEASWKKLGGEVKVGRNKTQVICIAHKRLKVLP